MKTLWGNKFDGFDCDHIIPKQQGGQDCVRNYQLIPREWNTQKSQNDPLLFAVFHGEDAMRMAISACLDLQSTTKRFKLPSPYGDSASWASGLIQNAEKRLKRLARHSDELSNGAFVDEPPSMCLPAPKMPLCREILEAKQQLIDGNGRMSEKMFLTLSGILSHRNHDEKIFQVAMIIPKDIGGASHTSNYAIVAKKKHGTTHVERKFDFNIDRTKNLEVTKRGLCALLAFMQGEAQVINALIESKSDDPNGILFTRTTYFTRKRVVDIAKELREVGKKMAKRVYSNRE